MCAVHLSSVPTEIRLFCYFSLLFWQQQNIHFEYKQSRNGNWYWHLRQGQCNQTFATHVAETQRSLWHTTYVFAQVYIQPVRLILDTNWTYHIVKRFAHKLKQFFLFKTHFNYKWIHLWLIGKMYINPLRISFFSSLKQNLFTLLCWLIIYLLLFVR